MPRLLIIDDMPDDRRLVSRSLMRAMPDAEIIEAADATTGLAAALDERPDCIILDRKLPDMDGLAVLCHLCEDVEFVTRIPVIMMTGADDEDTALEALRIGADDFFGKSGMTPANLFRAVQNAIEKAELRRQLAESQRLLRQLALYDPLTGLGNRNLFEDQFSLIHSGCLRNGTPYLVMQIDLDKFKPINDTYGHEIGDMVLMTVAARLNRVSRESDAFFRMGGDEFLGLIYSNVSRQGAAVLARRIGEAILEPIHTSGIELRVGCSIGIAIHPEDGGDKETLMRHADHAMYAAKRAGEGFAFHIGSDAAAAH